MCASPTAAVPGLLTLRVQAAAAGCCCIEASITIPKENVPATNRNPPSHPPRPHSRQPIPDSAIRCRQRRQQYSEPHVHISCVCAPGTSVPRGHTQYSYTHRYLLPLCPPDAPEREFTQRPAPRVIRNVDTFKQAVQYQTCPNQLIFLVFLVPQHGGRDVM